jgi:hypothetical protein
LKRQSLLTPEELEPEPEPVAVVDTDRERAHAPSRVSAGSVIRSSSARRVHGPTKDIRASSQLGGLVTLEGSSSKVDRSSWVYPGAPFSDDLLIPADTEEIPIGTGTRG